MRAAAFLLLAGLLAAACGGGGGGNPTGPPPEMPRIVLTPTGGGMTGAVNLASGAGSTATVLELEVRMSDVSDIYGLSFDLTYPQQQLRLDGVSEGSFLAQGGAQTSFLVNTATAGSAVVGITRLGPVAGAGGSGVLLTLRFTAIGAGSGTFGITRNSAVDATGADRSLTWGGAGVQVVL